jgi:glycerol-1-phosphate dehydrogenase [NAD(P)+]
MNALEQHLPEALRRAIATRAVWIGAGVLQALPSVLRQILPASGYVIIADENTWMAAGQRVAALLGGSGLPAAGPVILNEHPRVQPRAESARALAASLGTHSAVPIAVGAGVINDLVKYAASLAGRPYACVPTAASMDGYAASGAALREEGFKRTLGCPAPDVIVADLDVIATAPPEMSGWGYGDLSGKLVAGADWIIADALGEEPLNSGPFALVQDNILEWLADPVAIRDGRRDALEGLVRGLLMAGLAMQAQGNSRPASGSDHQFAHLWEMEGLAVDGVPVSHGACVGVGCLSMLTAYEWLLTRNFADIDPAILAGRLPGLAALRAEIAASFPVPSMAASVEAEVLAKNVAGAEQRLRRLRAVWPDLAARLARILPRAGEVRRWLLAAGAPADGAAIGLSAAQHAADYRRARLVRRRYTALDLLHELGALDEAVRSLFSGNGFWADRLEQGRGT